MTSDSFEADPTSEALRGASFGSGWVYWIRGAILEIREPMCRLPSRMPEKR